MTVTTTNISNEFTGDGSSLVYIYNFTNYSVDWVKVYIDGVLTVPFNVTVYPNQDTTPGGQVSLTAPGPVGASIVIEREVPLTQLTDYMPYTRFPAEDHEEALDKLTMVAQQQSVDIIANNDAIENLQQVELISGDTEMMTIANPLLIDDVTFNFNVNVANGAVKIGADGLIPDSVLPPSPPGSNFFPGLDPAFTITQAALLVGGNDPDTEQHIEVGPNVIQSKANINTMSDLAINLLGGNTLIGPAGTAQLNVNSDPAFEFVFFVSATQRLVIEDGTTTFANNDFSLTTTTANLSMPGNLSTSFSIQNLSDEMMFSVDQSVIRCHANAGDSSNFAAIELTDSNYIGSDYNVRLSYADNLAELNSDSSIRVSSDSTFGDTQLTLGRADITGLDLWLDVPGGSVLGRRFNVTQDEAALSGLTGGDSVILDMRAQSGVNELRVGYFNSSANAGLATEREGRNFAINLARANASGGGFFDYLLIDTTGEVVQARNVTTGSGLERVLTESDLPALSYTAHNISTDNKANTTTPTPLNELSLSLPTGMYKFTALIRFTTNGGGYRLQWAFSGGGSGSFQTVYASSGSDAGLQTTLGSGSSTLVLVPEPGPGANYCTVTATVFISANGESITLEWAQETSNPSSSGIQDFSWIKAEYIGEFT